MEITDFTVQGTQVVINSYPALPYDCTVSVWSVPTSYRATGYFVCTDNDIPDIQNPGSPVTTLLLPANSTLQQQEALKQLIDNYSLQIDNYIDQVVQTRKYNSIVSCASYATSNHPKYGPEARAAVAWRDAVWDYCEQLITNVLSGQIPMPTDAELIAGLPKLNW